MSSYKEEKDMRNMVKANTIMIVELPPFCKDFFNARRDLSGSSRLAYCYELLDFFEYLHENNSYFGQKDIRAITMSDLNMLQKKDLEEYFSYKETNIKGKAASASAATLKRTKSCLSTFWTYFVQENELATNPLVGIRLEKIAQRDPVFLNSEEKKRLLSTIQYGTGLTGSAITNHESSKERDYAAVYLFLHTGIRIEELVGIDIDDIDFNTHSVFVKRKGKKEQIVYFSDKAETALIEYLEVRNSKFNPYTSKALFLNKYGERITERSIERMIEKYVKIALPSRKNISPHKLRSTFATDMLEATGDIELVSKQLGHAKVSTTQIYAQSSIDKRKGARNLID